ncbi:hypothetical protein ACIP5Z_01750 [Rothia terrae]|uniref:hypothetical protein n=1 Tax=Rothia terrae TaxID=396015 RepID=UPI00381F79FE
MAQTENQKSVPTLTNGKFIGRARTDIDTTAQQAAQNVQTQLTNILQRKVDITALEDLTSTLTSNITDSDAKTALADAKASIAQETASREDAVQVVTQKINDVEGKLSGYAKTADLQSVYATKAELGSQTLQTYSGGTFSLGDPTEGAMVGVLATGTGTIGGQDVLPGDVWVFVGDGSNWKGYLAGGGAGTSVAGVARPVLAASSVTSSGVTVSWPPANGATSYEGRVNGGQIQTVTSPWNITGLVASTAQIIEVRSVGGASNSAWASVSVTTKEKPASAQQWSLALADSTFALATTDATNDTVVMTASPYGKFARSVNSIAVGATGYFEFTLPTAPTGNTLECSLSTYGIGGSERVIGLSIKTDGTIMRSGGTWAGGVSTGSTLSAGTRFRLYRNGSTVAIDQYQIATSSWVRLGEQVDSKGTSPLYLVASGNAVTGRVESLKGVTS